MQLQLVILQLILLQSDALCLYWPLALRASLMEVKLKSNFEWHVFSNIIAIKTQYPSLLSFQAIKLTQICLQGDFDTIPLTW